MEDKKNTNTNFFISEDEKNQMIEDNKKYMQQYNQYNQENKNDYSSRGMMSNEYNTDSDNMENEEIDSLSNINNPNHINRELICEFYQAIKDDNISFIEEFIKTEFNIRCNLEN